MRIPIIETRGTHYEVGYQIGSTAGSSLRAMRERTRASYGERWPRLRELSALFLAPTERHLPRVVEEMRGCADGADLPFDDLFLMSVEELLYEEVRRGIEGGRGGERETGRD